MGFIAKEIGHFSCNLFLMLTQDLKQAVKLLKGKPSIYHNLNKQKILNTQDKNKTRYIQLGAILHKTYYHFVLRRSH